MPSLEIRKLNKLYGDAHILHDIDLHVDEGEFVVFVGPSGCGKSTLLRMICGLDEVSSGLIAIDDEIVNDVPPAKRGIAMVFQSYALYPHMNVEQNMGYSLKLSKVPAAEITRRVVRVAETLQLTEYLKRKPRHLSGGQRQRVAIGRAIVREPKIFLFDEPLSNLDAALRVEMRIEIAKLKQRLGSTMIYVTHDQVEAMTLADKIVVLNKGFVEQIGAPLDLYNNPANRFVAGFIGSPKMNFLKCTDIANDGGKLSACLSARNAVRIAPACDLPKGVEIGMRPEHLDIVAADGADIAGSIVMIEKLGSDTYSYVDLGDGSTVLARMPGSFTPKVGDRVGLSIDSNNVHLFDSAGLALPRKLG